MSSPHDALFRCAFAAPFHARGWLASLLPASLAATIDWDTLAPLGERAHGPSLRAHTADLVFGATLRSGAPLLLIVEHKSTNDPMLASQVLRYSVHLRRAHRDRSSGTEPLVAPIVLHHGATTMRHAPAPGLLALPAHAARVLARAQPHQRLFVDDLAACDEAALRRPGLTPFAQLTLLALRFARSWRPDEVLAAIHRWADLFRAVEMQEGPLAWEDALGALTWYLVSVSEVSVVELAPAFAQYLTRIPETIMTTADRLRREGHALGRAEGRLEGKAEGMAEGTAELLLRLLQKRFGPLPPATSARIRAAALPELAAWAERMLDAKTLHDVLDPST